MIKNQALGGRSNKALIFLGLFLGLVSAVLVVVYLSNAGGGGGDVSSGVATPVVVASDSIPVGTKITAEMVTLKPISSDAVLADAFRDVGDVVDRVTKVPLVAGEQVIPTKVAQTGAAIADLENPPLAYVVPEGQRAISIQVSSVIGASGLIRPGDYVDVILSIEIQRSEDGGDAGAPGTLVRDQVASTILQNAQVLSIDQSVTRTIIDEGEADTAAVSDGGEADPEAATVTLAVSPVHGEVLTVAETCGENFGGRLALSLRRIGDAGQVATRSVWPNDGAPPSCAALLGLPSLQ